MGTPNFRNRQLLADSDPQVHYEARPRRRR